MDDAERKVLEDLLDKHLRELGEHFPDIQLMVSWTNENGNTEDLMRGRGNFYARLGMAREFLNRDASMISAREIKRELEPPDDYEQKA